MIPFLTALLAMLPAFALGWTVVRLFKPHVPGFFGWTLEVSLGIGMGAGISSLIEFLLTWSGVANRFSLLGIEIVALAGAGFVLARRDPSPAEESSKNPSWIWLLRIAAIIASLLLVLGFSNTFTSNPTGEWDASAIWNLRAEYLAGGPATWRYAVSNYANHPGYPLLVSGFIARTWIILGNTGDAVPAALSLIFSLATLGVLSAALASISEALGWLAALVLLATQSFVAQSATQYSDVPVAFFVLAATAMLACAVARDWPPGLLALAGIFAGFAAWTKNEGLPFAIAIAIVALWRARSGVKWLIAGAAVPILAALALKQFLAQGRESMFPQSAAQAGKMIVDPSRWAKIIASFAHNIWSLGTPWAHPILLLAILGFAFGFLPRQSWKWWLALAPLALIAADFGIYLMSMADLDWHLGTSNSRLILQVWPAFLFTYFLILRAPIAAVEEPKSAKKKRSRT